MNWTEEEIQRLVSLRKSGLVFEQIAKEMGRTVGSCKWQWLVLNKTPDEMRNIKNRRNLGKRLKRSETAPLKRSEMAIIYCPAEVWAERDAMMRQPRSLTAWICGDPAPTRSALSQRSA